VDAWRSKHPVERPRHPPVRTSEQRHEHWDEQRPDRRGRQGFSLRAWILLLVLGSVMQWVDPGSKVNDLLRAS
jgi:hypothetical protein